MKVSLLTGGKDKPYALGLLESLVSRDIMVDFISGDDMMMAPIVADKRVNFLNLRGDPNPLAPITQKIIRVLKYYVRLMKYAATTDTRVFHILWFNKFIWFDRTILNIYYRLLNKKLVFTAHNVNERERDGGNHILHRVSLKVFYALMNHVFVHTIMMKSQLVQEFKVPESKISVIPFGINNTIPKSELTRSAAKGKFGLKDHEKVLLFFGNIAPYKGLEYALHALKLLVKKDDSYRLIIAGRIKDCQAYWESIENIVKDLNLNKYLIRRIQFVPDEEVEIFFKASDVLILPYKFIYQSGVLFLSYSFGLPVIATDVGSLREDIIEGITGMVCRAEDPSALADKICKYFESSLFKSLEPNSYYIIRHGNEKYSWEKVGNITADIYGDLAK